MKSKYVAAALAFFLGIFGVHRFYLGKRFWGVVHFLLFWLCFVITVEENNPYIMLPALLGFIDAVLLFVMPQLEFDERYNRKYLNSDRENWEAETRRRSARRPARREKARQPADASEFKRAGIEKFRDYDYEGAIDYFEQALELQPNDPATHFNLACCYSILEDADRSFEHLENAVANGFKDTDKIKTHDALSFLRTRSGFDVFVANGYKRPASAEPEEKPLSLPDLNTPADDLLDQILKLGELRDKGVLTDEEFALQKRKILGD